MDRIGNSALNRLGENLLNLLGDNGSLAIILGVCLGRRLVGLAASGMNLSAVKSDSKRLISDKTHGVGEGFLKT